MILVSALSSSGVSPGTRFGLQKPSQNSSKIDPKREKTRSKTDVEINTHFERIFLNFGSVLGTKNLGWLALLASKMHFLSYLGRWLQLFAIFIPFWTLMGSLGHLLGLSRATLERVFHQSWHL